jgi:hypothetical protein
VFMKVIRCVVGVTSSKVVNPWCGPSPKEALNKSDLHNKLV